MNLDRRLRENLPQLRLSAASVLLTVVATLTLWPLFGGQSWLGDSLAAIAVVAVIGVAARFAGVPRVRVALLQILGLAVLVTARFAPSEATLGFIPSFASTRALADLVGEGISSINEQVVPVVPVPGIVLLTVIGIGLVALEVDLTAVACRCPAITGVVLLVVYGVELTASGNGTSWAWFAVGGAAWLLLLATGRREALREWADIVDDGRGERRSDRPAGVDPATAMGWRIGLGAVVAGVLVAGLLPGVGNGMLDRFEGAVGDSGTPSAADPVRLDLTATIRRNLEDRREIPLLRYRTDDASGQYLRLAVLNRFEEVAWQPARRPAVAPSVTFGEQPAPAVAASDVPATQVFTTVETYPSAAGISYLPAPYTPVNIDGMSPDWLWDTSTSTVFTRDANLGSVRYDVESDRLPPDAAALARQTGGGSVGPADRVVPEGLPASVASLAESATSGATSDYARAVRLQEWFRDSFRYSLDAEPTDTANAITSFLTSRVGYCQQFAATYALMARSLGLASRVVVGFTPGSAGRDGWYTVTTRDYHAWPEVWFDSAGWVRFEPTPRADAGSRVDVPAWSLPNPFAPLPSGQSTPSASAAPSPSASGGPTRQPAAEGELAVAPQRSLTDRLAPFGLAALVVLVIALAAAPGTIRAWRRRKRLDLPADDAGIEAAWAELEDTARDLGVPWAGGDTPRRTADALVRSAGLTGPAAQAVQELRRDLERSRYSGRPVTPSGRRGPADAVRTVRISMLAASTASDRLRARFAPRTAWRRR